MGGNQYDTIPEHVRVYRIGSEGSPVLVIENFLTDPTNLLRAAYQSTYTEPKARNFPGIRAPAPNAYINILIKELLPQLQRIFRLDGWSVVSASSDFSLITQLPDALTPRQRIPHSDTSDPGLLALLHYLTPGGCFGTSFYRHRATGFERVTVERRALYRKTLEDELRRSPPVGYTTGDTPLFEQTRAFEGRFNRLIVYQGYTLHCAQVAPDFLFNQAPHLGRLTANTFFSLRRPPSTQSF